MTSKKPPHNVESIRPAKRGRPRRDTVAIFLRVARAEAELVDEWRAVQTARVNRPEAVRQLLRKALARDGLGKKVKLLKFERPQSSRSRAASAKTASALAKLPRR